MTCAVKSSAVGALTNLANLTINGATFSANDTDAIVRVADLSVNIVSGASTKPGVCVCVCVCVCV